MEARGSPHVHGLAWLPGAPDLQLFSYPAAAEENHHQAIAFIDSVISTTNPALLPDVATCHKHLVLRQIHTYAIRLMQR